MTNLFGLCCLALAFFITAMPEAESPQRKPSDPVAFPVARSFGCDELARTCREAHKSAEVSQWTKNSKHGRIKRS